jgi:site-specific DNA recombinase
MFDLFSQHRRKRTVARLLNDAGYRSRKGSKFETRGVLRMLSDPAYKGLKRANYSQNIRGDYLKPASEWIYVEVPAIVPEDLWERCNAILASQKPPTKHATKPTAHLFSGLVACNCGTKMYVRTQGKTYVCMSCRNAVGKDELEEVFIEQLRGIVVSPEAMALQLEAADQALVARQQLLVAAEGDKARVTSEMAKLYKLYLEDHVSGRLFSERNAPLEERFRQLENEVPALAAEVDFLRVQIRSSDQILSDARDLYSRWPTLDFATKRLIVENVTDRILVEKNDITIELAYLPTSDKPRPKDQAKKLQTLGGTRHRRWSDRRHRRAWRRGRAASRPDDPSGSASPSARSATPAWTV